MEPLKVIKLQWAERWPYFLNLHTWRASCQGVLWPVMVAENRNTVFFASRDGDSSKLTNVDIFDFGNKVNSATAAGDLILAL